MQNSSDNHFDNHFFSTSDTPLAAYLISEGFELLRIDYEGFRAFFVFDGSDEILQRVVSDYNRAVALGNIVAYEKARKGLVARVKGEIKKQR